MVTLFRRKNIKKIDKNIKKLLKELKDPTAVL